MGKQNARAAARNLMIREVLHSKKIPVICKNLMIENIQLHMTALGSALGCIELAARRAHAHGVDTDQALKGGKDGQNK